MELLCTIDGDTLIGLEYAALVRTIEKIQGWKLTTFLLRLIKHCILYDHGDHMMTLQEKVLT